MQIIYLDISNNGVVPTIYAKQGDIGRKVQVIFMDSGIPYKIPENAKLSVWYDGDSGDGNYTDIGDKSAIVVENNKVTFELITQMLNNDGEGIVCLIMNVGKEQIGSWNIHYLCEKVPGFDSEGASSYFTAFSESINKLKNTDKTLTKEGYPADAKATGDKIDDLTAADIGAAPSGFGLGVSAASTTDLNTATGCGWYVFDRKGTANTPFGYGVAMTLNRYGARFTQIAFNPFMAGDGEICVRSHDGTEWLPWEYINPPMSLNEEYRTIERRDGKPVYVKRISFGALPASGSLKVPTGISGGTLVSLTGTFYLSGGSAEAYPVMNGSGPKCLAWVSSGCTNLYTQAIVDCSAHTGEFIIKYTKD